MIIKISILGPCLYLDSVFNQFDFCLVVLGIPAFFDPTFQFVGCFRVLRLARLASLIRAAEIQRALQNAGKGAAPKVTIGLSRLSGLIFEFVSPMINNILVVMIVMYMFSLIGMQFFVFTSILQLPPFDLVVVNETAAKNATAAEIGSLFSSTLGRNNFNCFGNAWVTMYNIGVMNGWYQTMVSLS